MNAEELIRIISNKALNKTLKENDKLVIQDCCKELYEKKCHKPYKIVKYEVIVKPHSKRPRCKYCSAGLCDCFDEVYSDFGPNPFMCDCDDSAINYSRERIMRTDENSGTQENPQRNFPNMIWKEHIEEFNVKKYLLIHDGDKSYLITSIEDI